jgi:hypothetical protein
LVNDFTSFRFAGKRANRFEIPLAVALLVRQIGAFAPPSQFGKRDYGRLRR